MEDEEKEFANMILGLTPSTGVSTIPQDLISHILNRRCILFLGSGASKEAGAPTSAQLAAELADRYLDGHHRSEPLAKVAVYIEHKPGAGRRLVLDHVVKRLSNLSPVKAHDVLTQYPWTAIFTTNYDLLIESAYKKSSVQKQIISVLSSSDLSMQLYYSHSNAVFLYKLHGCISRPYSNEVPLVISEDDYDTTVSNRVALLRLLETYKYTHTFLFVGYSFGDPDLTQIWRAVNAELGKLSQWAYAIWPNHSSEQEELWKSRCVLLLNRTFSEFFDALPAPMAVEANQFPSGVTQISTRSGVIELLTSLLKQRDPSRYAMSKWVAKNALLIAKEMGLSEQELRNLKDSALLSDIGLLTVSDLILFKPGPLTDNEWQEITDSPTIGQDLLSVFPELREVGRIVASVHERFNGNGYPNGLRGEKIPIAARVIAVLQAFYSLTHSRPYRPAFSLEEAAQKIHEMAGSIFDPSIVAIFEATMQQKA